ncbi:MAG: LCP family protein [Lachnospiraceae bacterium]|nr:LCP family protein [Lachnospiraceae bacterium]
MATNSNHRSTTGRQNTAKKKAGSKRKLIIFAVEILVIAVMILALYLVTQMTSDTDGPKVTVLEPEKLEIKQEVVENESMQGYKNIALFGVDATEEDELYKGSRSDSIMIASINMDTGDIKLVSVYRDTFLNLGNDSYRKCNAAYSYGGAEQAIRMLNMNLDMDIKEFITVGYKGLAEVIDGLGGVYIDVDAAELAHINNYQLAIAKVLDKDYVKVKEAGYQLLDGIQATAYCRIRYTAGNDFKRAARQREVIMAIEEQAKKADLDTLMKVFNVAIDDVYTNIKTEDFTELLSNIMNYRIVAEDGFPQEDMRTAKTIGAKGSSVIPLDLVSNVVWLHEFLFEDQEYVVTESVREYSQKIKEETDPYINSGN